MGRRRQFDVRWQDEGTESTTHNIDTMSDDDWPAVRAIYAAGLATGLAAFASTPPTQSDWNASHLSVGRLVARVDGMVRGWAALTPVADT